MRGVVGVRRRASVALALVGLVASLVVVLVAPPALAHDGDGDGHDEDSAEHAAQDLAGVPMSTIEAQTRARRRRLAALGELPAREPAAPAAPAARADAAGLGAWGDVLPTPVVPVFTAVLPNGRVLMWDSVGDQGVDAYAVHDFTRAAVLDPVTGASHRVDLQGHNIFCAGYVQLSNGNVLVVGGNRGPDQEGIRETHLFDWRTETWSRGPDMAADRWYPAVTALGNGEALIVAGGPGTAEVFQPDGTLRPLTGFTSFSNREYPFLVPRLDGGVEVVGPDLDTDRYDVAGAGSSSRTGTRDQTYRNYGSYATYDYGKTLVAGGGPVDGTGAGSVEPTATAVVVDTVRPGSTTSTPTASMAVPRRMHNLTVLADGSVLATGGMDSTEQTLVDLGHAVRLAERWDPSTGAWTSLASASRAREYHSTAMLLPDGRVLTGGGGVCGDCVRAGYLEKNVETYSPPYLFDAAGGPAVRPSLTGVPDDLPFGAPFSFTSSSAASIGRVALVRLSADTHGVDQGQRYLPLSYDRSGTTLTVDAPGNGNVAPPGYYLLFAVTTGGVPSMGAMVHVGPTYASPSRPLSVPAAGPGTTAGPGSGSGPGAGSGAASCLEVRGGGRNTRHQVVRWTCTGGANQTWRLRADSTLRVAGGCLTFGTGAGLPRAGDTVRLSRCSGGARQRTRVPGRTIRPGTAPNLCVATSGASLTPGTGLRLSPCRALANQQWTWRKR